MTTDEENGHGEVSYDGYEQMVKDVFGGTSVEDILLSQTGRLFVLSSLSNAMGFEDMAMWQMSKAMDAVLGDLEDLAPDGVYMERADDGTIYARSHEVNNELEELLLENGSMTVSEMVEETGFGTGVVQTEVDRSEIFAEADGRIVLASVEEDD